MSRADVIAMLDPRRWPGPHAPSEVERYEATAARLGAGPSEWTPRPLELLDTSAREVDALDFDGLLLTLDVLGRPLAVSDALRADPRPTAWERLVLAALEERASGRTAVMVASEIVVRVRPDALTDDRLEVEEAIDALVRRGALARLAGGGFVLRWRDAA